MTSIRVVGSAVVLLAVGFLALTLIVAMTLWLGERARIAFDDTVSARDTRASAAESRAAVQTAESSQRGYVLTGNQIYLAPYGTAKAAAEQELERARRLLANDEGVQPALRKLGETIAEKFAEMDRSIAFKRDRRDAEALAVIRSNRGKALMDEANVYFSGIIRAADERLIDSAEQQKQNTARLRLTTIGSGMLIVVVVAIVTLIMFRYTRELAAAREVVATLNLGLEERVEERTAELARANHEIQHFAHVVSHDLRAPLVSIVGFTGEIEGGLRPVRLVIDSLPPDAGPDRAIADEARRAVTDDMPEAIGFIRTSTRRMDSLIEGVLKLSRAGQRLVHPEQIELADIVRTSADAIRHQLTAADGTITLDLAVPPLMTDRLALEQITANLLDNAVKYRSPERPLSIEVRARSIEGERFVVEIADNGRGVAEQDLGRIFDLFSRVGAAGQRGDGVGLAHVRAIVRKLGGDVTVSSALDVGTTFRVVLPTRLRAYEDAAA